MTKTYLASAFTDNPKLEGNVHGVVVQITNSASAGTTSLPSLTLKATKIEGDVTSLYSTSASANVDSLEGDQ